MKMSDYLSLMASKGASDIFFSVGSPVLVKIEGICHVFQGSQALKAGDVKQLAYTLLQEKHIRQFEEHWELNTGVTVPKLGRFRLNLLRQKNDIAMVIRYIREKVPTIEELNMPTYLKSFVMEQRGLVLVGGATGSGKSSTLAAMINYRNSMQHCHILTIEDPIEYIHLYKKAIVNQREVGTDTKSYAHALKNAMREAPDVILIGEIRDQDTMHNAIAYAETGHLCLATIHASNSVETLDRILNFFPEREHKQVLIDLSRNLRAIICQRLIRGANNKRWPAVEVLRDSPYIADLIKQGNFEEIRAAFEDGIEDELVSFDTSILQLCAEDKISKNDALNHADSRHNFAAKSKFTRNYDNDIDDEDIPTLS